MCGWRCRCLTYTMKEDKSSNSRIWNRVAYEIDYILSDHVNGKFLFISCLID